MDRSADLIFASPVIKIDSQGKTSAQIDWRTVFPEYDLCTPLNGFSKQKLNKDVII